MITCEYCRSPYEEAVFRKGTCAHCGAVLPPHPKDCPPRNDMRGINEYIEALPHYLYGGTYASPLCAENYIHFWSDPFTVGNGG